MPYARWLAFTALCCVSAVEVSAQDIEMLGRRYGTQPPASYYARLQQDRTAFEFRRERLRGRDALARAFRDGAGGPELGLGPRDSPVVGNFLIPVLLGLYSNTSAPYTRGVIEDAYFGPSSGTITDYYTEVSGGRVTLSGDVRDWVQTARPDTIYTVGQSGIPFPHPPLGGGGAANFVYDVLALQSGIDWGIYDNDGADGVPNSGDDDGFVDVLAVLHPAPGGECGGGAGPDRIWSHRWALSEAVGTTFQTSTPAAGGGFIEIDDYTIQPSRSCSGGSLNQIGVFTHELGHAFGLPDLYDTDATNGQHQGVGIWDLMGTGSWGCNNAAPQSPCHLGAWSKEMLGWATVVTLAPDADHGTITVPPVETSETLYRIDANDGSGEYYLLENRQRIGYDQQLYHEGLLVWQIDPDWYEDPAPCGAFTVSRWECNSINAFGHMGVWLRQADGLDELGQPGGGRGDAADPFPGQTGNDAFHAVTVPAATSYLGGPSGVTLFDITESGDDLELRVVTGFSTVTVRANGASGPNGLFVVDGMPVDPPATTFLSAPFVPHTLEAVAAETLAPGQRRPFTGWSDAPTEPRVRTVTTPLVDREYVAEYGPTENELAFTLNGAVAGIPPATIVSTPPSPDLWYPVGTDVTLELVGVTGYDFLGWTGDLTGQPNPADFTMTSPLVAGADYAFVYAVTTSQIDVTATVEQDLQLVAENGTAPYSWRLVTGALPTGLVMSPTGRITGRSVDVGSFPVTLEAIDGIGLPAVGAVTLDVSSPPLTIEQLTSTFLLADAPLDAVEREFLDRQGNSTGGYDIGDFRAWVLANPTLPLSAFLESAVERRAVIVPLRFPERSDAR